MPSVGPVYGASYTNDNSIGVHAWTNPERTGAADGSGADSGVVDDSSGTNYLKGLDFDFSSIPDDAAIVGVLVEFELIAAIHSVAPGTEHVSLVVGGSVVGEEKIHDDIGGGHMHSLGGATDLWNLALTPADIKSADFGLTYRYVPADGSESVLLLDYVRMTVYWQDDESSSSSSMSSSSSSSSVSSSSSSSTGTIDDPRSALVEIPS